jgi:hypothetical protein
LHTADKYVDYCLVRVCCHSHARVFPAGRRGDSFLN